MALMVGARQTGPSKQKIISRVYREWSDETEQMALSF